VSVYGCRSEGTPGMGLGEVKGEGAAGGASPEEGDALPVRTVTFAHNMTRCYILGLGSCGAATSVIVHKRHGCHSQPVDHDLRAWCLSLSGPLVQAAVDSPLTHEPHVDYRTRASRVEDVMKLGWSQPDAERALKATG
jgi:hypothetical protein